MRSQIPNSQNNTFAEFFSGIGLMRIGLEREGWTLFGLSLRAANACSSLRPEQPISILPA